jgi:DNA repair exonuclease SbcCD ATPase subunit
LEQQRLHAELEEKDKTITELKKKVEELSKLTQDARTMRDEMDILREKAAEVQVLEERLKKLQKRSDDANDLRKQIKVKFHNILHHKLINEHRHWRNKMIS